MAPCDQGEGELALADAALPGKKYTDTVNLDINTMFMTILSQCIGQ